MPNPILDAARARLTAIAAERSALDREERELRAMVTAAEGAAHEAPTAPVLPLWPPTINPSPSPITPWVVKADHGGACACPQCVPRVTCGEGWTSATAQAFAIYRGDVNPNAASAITSGTITLLATQN